MRGAEPVRLIPRLPPAARFAIFGAVIAGLVYTMASIEPAKPAPPPPAPLPPIITVPTLDRTILAEAADATREQRLLVESEPLRHLLEKAIDVTPTVATAIGRRAKMVPVEEVRARLDTLRWQWLWYEGVLEDLAGPREGHPLRGHSIFEATVRLADGNHALAAFSLPPDPKIKVGGWVRIEGYLLKLRDTTYPTAIERAPMLVGRGIEFDYEDWPPVTKLDAELMASVNDKSRWPGDKRWHTVEEDQTEALWHLAAYARDTRDQISLADWRRVQTLNAAEMHRPLMDDEVPRGTRMRVFGSLKLITFLAAPANPAGIETWTVAWVQVREYGGHLVPIWVPKRVDLPTHVQLEVRGHFYRWFAYETVQDGRVMVPLFVAADLDVYELEVDKTMGAIGAVLGAIVVVFLGLVIWMQRRAAKDSVAHSREMDARRRRRRERGPITKDATPQA